MEGEHNGMKLIKTDNELVNPAALTGTFTVNLSSVGNPDYGQYAPLSDPETVVADSLVAIGREVRRYIQEWDLGGGNWPMPVIHHNGKPLCAISYNGRLWAVREQVAA